MSVTCLLEGNHPELSDANIIDFGHFFPGLRDLWIEFCRPDTADEQYSFPLPKWRVIKLYAGICSLLALKPRNHPLYPELNPSSESPSDGYWMLVKASHISTDPESEYFAWLDEFTEQHKVDREVLAALYRAYVLFIAPISVHELGGADGEVDAFWFDLLREFADQLVLLLRYDDITFTAHV